MWNEKKKSERPNLSMHFPLELDGGGVTYCRNLMCCFQNDRHRKSEEWVFL